MPHGAPIHPRRDRGHCCHTWRPVARLRSSSRTLLLAGVAAVVVVAVVALFVLRDGGTAAAGTGSDPATVTPPRVAVFADVFLHPPGEQGANARALLARALGARDPGARLGDLVGHAVAGGRSGIDYRSDVAPWLGGRAGVFYRAVAGPGSRGTLLLAAADPGRARATLVTGPRAGTRRRYRGVAYAIRPDGTAAAVVGRFAVIGDEGGVRAAVDAERGYALAGTDRFRSRTRRARPDRVGLVYFDLLGFGGVLKAGPLDPALAKQLRERLAITDPTPVVATLSAKPRALLADFGPRPGDVVAPGQGGDTGAGGGVGDGGTPPGEADNGSAQGIPGQGTQSDVAGNEAAPGSGSSPSAPSAGLSLLSAPLLPSLPADTWLAIGINDAGDQLDGLLDPARDPAIAQGAVTEVLRRLGRDGVDLRGEVLPALGGAALFLRGSSPSTLDGGAVIESLDPAATRGAVRRLARALGAQPGWRVSPSDLAGGGGGYRIDAKGVAKPVYVLPRGNRIVVGYGRRAAMDALDAPDKLGGTPGFQSASLTLAPGLRPDSYLDLRRAMRVLDATSMRRQRTYAGVRPILSVFDYVVFAAKNRIRRFAFGVN